MHTIKGLLFGIPTLGRLVNLSWALALKAQNPPINFNTEMMTLYGLPVAQARETIAEHAVKNNFKYLFFLGDDVVIPAHTLQTLIYRLEQNEDIGVVGGIYCSKAAVPNPLVFRGNGGGSYWDWKVGEFFEVTGLGMDATLIRVDVFKDLPKPWFKTVEDAGYLDNENRVELWTEDLYFCNKVLEHTKYKIYADATVICEHWDFAHNRCYTLPPMSLPTRQLETSKKKMIDIGCGTIYKQEEGYDVVRVDIRDEVAPDYRCDIRLLPFANEEFDKIYSSHVLEHFGRAEINSIFKEWLRVLKPGGEVEIIVPNIEWAFSNFNSSNNDAMNVLYGAQDNPYDYHKVGFTPTTIKELFNIFGVSVKSVDLIGYNIIIKGTK